MTFVLVTLFSMSGNVSFKTENEDRCSITDAGREAVKTVSKLLQLTAKDLEKAITSKVLVVGGNKIVQPMSVAQATDKRDALAKGIYSNLFDWLVICLNKTIAASKAEKEWGFIGVLVRFFFYQTSHQYCLYYRTFTDLKCST